MTDEERRAKNAAADAAIKAFKERPRDASREEIERLWEAMWEAVDFSWAGLADAGWELGDKAFEAQKLKRWRAPMVFPGRGRSHGEGEHAWKEATLQDYWRWSLGAPGFEDKPLEQQVLLHDSALLGAGLLVECDERLFHVLHSTEAPAAVETGVALRAAVLARLAVAGEAQGPSRSDGRLQMAGSRAQGVPPMWREFAEAGEGGPRVLHVNATFASLGEVEATSLVFGDQTSFAGVKFGDRTRFTLSHFGQDASFTGAHFGVRATFSSSTFGYQASFVGATFANEASFGSAKFADGAAFWACAFGDDIRFDSADFGERAEFESAIFGERTVFSSATMGKNAQFTSARFGRNLSFYSATFGENASFRSATFGPKATFAASTFGDDAAFENAVFADKAGFEGARFGSHAWFRHATFGDEPSFRGAVFGDRASFEDVQFGTETRFVSAEFGHPVYFRRATFAPQAFFTGARFKGRCAFDRRRSDGQPRFQGRFRFQDAIFEETADFSETDLPAGRDAWEAFEGARFREPARFKDFDLIAFAAFDGAVFEKGVILDDPGRKADGLYRQARRAALNAARAQTPLPLWRRLMPWPHAARSKAVERHMGALAGGFRTLKLAMAEQSDIRREQQFYRYELKTRARQPSTPFWERAAAGFYGLASDYGASIARPFAALAVLLVAFAAGFYGLGAGLGQLGEDSAAAGWQAWEFSWNNVFRPLSALSPEIVERDGATLASRLLYPETSNGWGAFARAMATVESLIALTLAFLFALAVRRRFQLS